MKQHALYCVVGCDKETMFEISGVWSLVAGLVAVLCLHLHTLEKYRTLDIRHSIRALDYFVYTGCFSAVGGAIGKGSS